MQRQETASLVLGNLTRDRSETAEEWKMRGLVNNSHNIQKLSTWIKDMKGGRGEGKAYGRQREGEGEKAGQRGTRRREEGEKKQEITTKR